MGRKFDDLIGKLDQDFVPKEQAEVFQENDRRVLRDGEINAHEEPLTDSSGELRTIVTRKSRFVLTGSEPLLIGCITDISDFRQAHRHNPNMTILPGLQTERCSQGS